MLKKVLSLLFLVLMSTGCQRQNESTNIPLLHSKQTVMEKDGKQVTRFYHLSKEIFESMMNKKSSFVAYILSSGCQTCDTFGYTLKSYVKENEYILPFLYMDEYLSTTNALPLSDSTLLFIQEGKVIDYKSDFSKIGSKTDLANYLSTKTYDSGISVFNQAEDNTTLADFETYSFSSRANESIKPEESYLFIKESKITDYNELIHYMVNAKIQNLVFNEEQQKNEASIFDIPYKDTDALKIDFTGSETTKEYLNMQDI
jgi:hypothetical protein